MGKFRWNPLGLPGEIWTPQGPELTGLIQYLCISNEELLCTTDHMSGIATIRLSRISNNAELPQSRYQIRLNSVYLVSFTLLRIEPRKSYSYIIKISIRELTILKTIGYIALVGCIPTIFNIMCKKERTWIEAVFYSMFTVGIITIILLLISLIQKYEMVLSYTICIVSSYIDISYVNMGKSDVCT